jgi:MOSC domain-containing protein YiiM
MGPFNAVSISIHSLNIALPLDINCPDGTVLRSGILKKPTTKKVEVNAFGIVNDDSEADCHGSEEMALHVFAFENYDYYHHKAGRQVPMPLFGENLILKDYCDEEARVGDVLTIGNVKVQVSQPTIRCKNIGKVHGLPLLLKWIHEELRTGYYLRVLEAGSFSVNSKITLRERGPEFATISKLNHLMFRDIKNKDLAEKILALPDISGRWVADFKRLRLVDFNS